MEPVPRTPPARLLRFHDAYWNHEHPDARSWFDALVDLWFADESMLT